MASRIASIEHSVRAESSDEKLLKRLCIPVIKFEEFQRIVLLSSWLDHNKVKQVWQELHIHSLAKCCKHSGDTCVMLAGGNFEVCRLPRK